jgi:hypothetical protein
LLPSFHIGRNFCSKLLSKCIFLYKFRSYLS